MRTKPNSGLTALAKHPGWREPAKGAKLDPVKTCRRAAGQIQAQADIAEDNNEPCEIEREIVRDLRDLAKQIESSTATPRKRVAKLPNHAADETGDPNNIDRAKWAGIALRAFASETGQKMGREAEDIICDLIANLGHFCDRLNDVDFTNCLRRARDHYNAETQGKGRQFDADRLTVCG